MHQDEALNFTFSLIKMCLLNRNENLNKVSRGTRDSICCFDR
jgi:hypothetical protein